MSYQVDQACYGSVESAASASLSKVVGTIVISGGEPYVVGGSVSGGDQMRYTLMSLSGSGSAVTTNVPYMAQPCQMLSISDGLTMGWMVAGVWVGVYCLMFLGKVLRGESGGDYGNT